MSFDFLASLLPIGAMLATAYFFILRPQQKKIQEKNDLFKNLKPGDEILLNSGIQGVVESCKNDDVFLIVSQVMGNNVVLRVHKSFIVSFV